MNLPAKKELPAGLPMPGRQPVIYSNIVRIAHSPADFVLDFAHLLPGEKQAHLGARILMTPLSAKLLLRALTENLSRFETAFGEINVPVNSSLADNLFRPFQHPPETPPEDNKPE